MPHILEELHCYSDISIERRETFLKLLEMCDFDGAHELPVSQPCQFLWGSERNEGLRIVARVQE